MNDPIAPERPREPEPVRIGLLDHEPPWDALLQEWLLEAGFELAVDGGRAPHLLLVGLSFPRRADRPPLERARAAWPGVPVLALSPTLLADVAADGELARRLQVQGLIALPTRRERLLAMVGRALECAP